MDALRQLDEKSNLFRLYLKDVVGPKGNLHRHKLLFASQYLIEAAVNLLGALDKVCNSCQFFIYSIYNIYFCVEFLCFDCVLF
jgi:hypothetical protein